MAPTVAISFALKAPRVDATSLIVAKFLNEYDQQKVDSWIHENCVGRYCMIKDVKWSGNSWKAVTTIGFEEPSDMTLFGLSGLLQTKLPN